jgi:transglutaminase-like putative cysteine protease
MSESEGSGSGGPGVAYGEVALVLATVAALVVAAALLPGAGLGGSGATGNETASGGTTSTATSTAMPGEEGDAGTPPGGSLGGGSPSGVPLSQPPEETQIGSAQSIGRSLAQTPQFVVEGPTNTYWRQTAYTTYTGSSWSSSPQWQSIDAGVPNDARTVDGRAMDYRVTLLVPSSSLPTAWQPSGVRVANASAGVEASTVGGVRTTRRLPAGTTYRGRSAAPPDDPAALRDAGTDYPDGIEERYTQLPETTPERVGAFTDELTADAETPYDTATTVRDWLKQKPYSLNASHEAGEPVADQFIFEMESGYCQYYATSMVVMLRTQGIPARYVVGYAPGERVGEDRYLVTADRGHAWVEVFFPDTGWVRFDPTGSGRLPVQNPQPPYDISLNRSAVAGASVTVSVEKNDTPVVGAPVEINDDRVGWTGADGTVRTQLPYAAEFTVTARPPDAATKYEGEAGETTAATAAERWAGEVLPAGRDARPAPPITADHDGTNHSSRTYRSDTNVTLSVEGTAVAGGGVTVVATIADVPVREATVTLDGARVGTTGPDGRLGVSLDGVGPGTHRLSARRGAVEGTTTFRVRPPGGETTATDRRPSLNVSVDAPLSLPLPGGSATVRTTRNGTPVGGARVSVGGSDAGTTGENGTVGVSLPAAGSTAVVARGPDGSTARTTLPLRRNAALVALLALGGVALVGRELRRRGVTVRGVVRSGTAALTRVAAWAASACVRAAELLLLAGRALRRGLSRLATLPRRLVTQGLAALAGLHPGRLLRWLRSWLAGLWARAGSGSGTGAASTGSRRATDRSDDAEAASTPTLRDLWREFVGLVGPPRVRTRTPGEIARYAVARGFPSEPVRTLTEAYRDAEYGRVAVDDDRLSRARDAIRAVREAVRGGEES